ncbi:FCS-Like Zinc finger 8-like [Dioscorea cayenensis subsp. rotundata]|uniref:FCS-Like Zinc finger 8-like n=1 Tax=Dioscorea cayennensis subsp. rotundata TaxID=55577 RepID=A0AB40BU85_DIOCR|nr:FCS-Like Zinc finger 8-like [Dioscorea cayenensis subsp. rotundata]
MLGKRSRAKQGGSSLFCPVNFKDSGAAMSPTSILETKHFSRPVGLGIVDALTDDEGHGNPLNQDSRMVLFGSKLKIQVPSSINGPFGSPPSSPIEFGIKTKTSQLALFSPARRSPTPEILMRSLSSKEIELSEDYTCVISHGPNPRTTHIFDDCIIETCGDGFIASRKENALTVDAAAAAAAAAATTASSTCDDFLSFCYACNKALGQGKDTFMYRGEKAFCSHECRNQEMLFEEELEKFSRNSSC